MILTPYDWFNKFYSFYVATLVSIVNRLSLGIDKRCGSQPDKSKLALYKVLIHCKSYLKQLYLSGKAERFSYKGGCGICEHTCIEVFNRRAGLGYRLTALGY